MHPTLVTSQTAGLDVGAGRKVRFGDFRDPFVWKEVDTCFQLMGSGVQATDGKVIGGTALLYTSKNLTDWTYSGPLMVGDVAAHSRTGQVWELPTFLPIGKDAQGRERRALLVNPAFPAGTDPATLSDGLGHPRPCRPGPRARRGPGRRTAR
ncbi:hypothetical protein [Streptomyces sp. NPDC006134]|uniref:hypothetical protein n=1 Tax=Streptomyces sp. NPDC006134 TaxID=3154467 RepID=UPI0033C87842